VVLYMSRSKLYLITSLVLLNLALVAAAYYIGRRTHERSDRARNGSYTQAILAFTHYRMYSQIATELEKKCYEAALTNASEMKKLQISLLAEHLRRTGNNPDLVEYLKLRDPELLQSVLAGHIPEPQSYTTHCP
jgi:hypothetical protein